MSMFMLEVSVPLHTKRQNKLYYSVGWIQIDLNTCNEKCISVMAFILQFPDSA